MLDTILLTFGIILLFSLAVSISHLLGKNKSFGCGDRCSCSEDVKSCRSDKKRID